MLEERREIMALAAERRLDENLHDLPDEKTDENDLIVASSSQLFNGSNEPIDDQLIEEDEEKRKRLARELRNTNVPYRFVPAARKNQQVLYSIDEKQRYKKNKYDKGSKSHGYTCCVDKCTARVFLNDKGECIFSPKFEGHSHAKTFEHEVKTQQFKRDCEKECAKLDSINGQLVPVKVEEALGRTNDSEAK